nr:Mpv17 PMP22 domain containing protein [Haemonchus contortus]
MSVRRLLDKFASCNAMKNHLFFLNTTTCVVQLSLGDFLQQLIHGDIAEKGWDHMRSARMGGTGFVIGPMMTAWYIYLDGKYVGRSLPIVIRKTLVDACTNPVFSSTIITVSGMLEGKHFFEAFREYTSKMFHILKVDLSVWPPSQFVSFLLLPPRLRVVYINAVYLIYSCVISFIKHNPKSEVEKYL